MEDGKERKQISRRIGDDPLVKGVQVEVQIPYGILQTCVHPKSIG